jgi:hypothetical protein
MQIDDNAAAKRPGHKGCMIPCIINTEANTRPIHAARSSVVQGTCTCRATAAAGTHIVRRISWAMFLQARWGFDLGLFQAC